MTISALPPITYPIDKTIFPGQVDAFIPALSTFITEANATAAALNLASTNDTSATNVLIGTGSKSFTVSAGKSYSKGMWLTLAVTASPTVNSIVGQVDSYSGTALVVNVPSNGVFGSGTYSAWTIALTGAPSTLTGIKQLESIDYTLAGNALTLKLNPTNLDFRSTTFTNGVPVNITNAAQLTTTISSGSTGGTVSGVQSDIILLAINNVGTMELAWTNLAGGLNLDENGLISTVAEGGAGAADSANVIYSTTTRSSVAYRVVGIFRSTQTTAGTWAQIPALVQGVGGQALVSRKIVDAAMPAFGAYQSVAQAIASATFTKVSLQTEEYDTANAFDSTTNFRFTPLVAGYYQVSGRTAFAAGQTSHTCSIYKNGISHKRGSMGTLIASAVASLVFLNGTTDYVEMYIYQASGASQSLVIAGEETYFNATLAKAT